MQHDAKKQFGNFRHFRPFTIVEILSRYGFTWFLIFSSTLFFVNFVTSSKLRTPCDIWKVSMFFKRKQNSIGVQHWPYDHHSSRENVQIKKIESFSQSPSQSGNKSVEVKNSSNIDSISPNSDENGMSVRRSPMNMPKVFRSVIRRGCLCLLL